MRSRRGISKLLGKKNLVFIGLGLLAAVGVAGAAGHGGLFPTTPTSTGKIIGKSGGHADLGYVFGNAKCFRVTGKKFEDINGNGKHEYGEPPIAGIPIKLTGVDGLGNYVEKHTVTDKWGVFDFPCLAPGEYQAHEVIPYPGFVPYPDPGTPKKHAPRPPRHGYSDYDYSDWHYLDYYRAGKLH